MMYVLGAPSLVATATELVIAFVMGIGGTIKYSLHGQVDIRLALILLAGSLFGIQLGVIGTIYVKPFMIKVVMAAIMLIVPSIIACASGSFEPQKLPPDLYGRFIRRASCPAP